MAAVLKFALNWSKPITVYVLALSQPCSLSSWFYQFDTFFKNIALKDFVEGDHTDPTPYGS